MNLNELTLGELRDLNSQINKELFRRKNTESVKTKFGGPVQLWKITTEGDVEGRTTKEVAIEHGHIADLALKYKHHCYYSLKFSPVETPDKLSGEVPKSGDEVHVSLDIKSGTWDAMPKERPATIRKWLGREDIEVKESNYYASVVLRKK